MNATLDIYTDGSCLNNPGKGGWGIVVVKADGTEEYSNGYEKTTNSRMEMMAILMALKYAEKHNSTGETNIYSDSNFIVQAFNSHWIDNWKRKGWKKSKNEDVANIDLWKAIYPISKRVKVNFIKVKAHSGIKYNEQVDELAKASAMGNNLSEDKGYSFENISATKTQLDIYPTSANNITLENVLSNGLPSIKIKNGNSTITVSRQQLEEFLK